MRCISLERPFKLVQKKLAEPKPRPGEALVRVHRIGVCGTDLHAFQGNQPYFSYPRVLGHELAVEVVDSKPNEFGIGVGSRCLILPYLECGSCIACRSGKPNCCEGLQVLGVHTDGGMKEYMVVPLSKLIPAPTLSFDQAAMVENQSIGAHAVRRAQLQVGENVLVIGAGPIGLGVVQVAKAKRARVIVMDVDDRKLEFCREVLGVEDIVNARNDPQLQVKKLTEGDCPTAVFDATGNRNSMESAIEFCAHGGRVVYVGIVKANIAFFHPDFHKRELTLLSSRNATREDFEYVIDAIEKGVVVTDPLITHRVELDQVPPNFETWVQPGSEVIKAVVNVEDG